SGWACARISSNVGCALFFFSRAGGGLDGSAPMPCMISSNEGARLRTASFDSSGDSGLSLIEPCFCSASARAARHTSARLAPSSGGSLGVEHPHRGDEARLFRQPCLLHARPADEHFSARLRRGGSGQPHLLFDA